MVELRTQDLSISNPPTSTMDGAINAWHSWRVDEEMPAWKKVDLLDLPSAIVGTTVVVDVLRDPSAFRYRFWGSGLTQLHGIDLTGQTLEDLPWPNFRELTRQAYQRVIEEQAPWLYVGEYVKARELVAEEFVLRLPLSSDGIRVDGIVTVVEPKSPYDEKWFV